MELMHMHLLCVKLLNFWKSACGTQWNFDTTKGKKAAVYLVVFGSWSWSEKQKAVFHMIH